MKRFFSYSLLLFATLIMVPQFALNIQAEEVQNQYFNTHKDGFVDLGLPSGTWWEYDAYENRYCTYAQALAIGNLPNLVQAQELVDYCQWQYDENNHRYVITGPNGNKIVIRLHGSAMYYYGKRGDIRGINFEGIVWVKYTNDECRCILTYASDKTNYYIQNMNEEAGFQVKRVAMY